MHRELIEALISWKNQPSRMPLLLRGARQVGKTYLASHFGKEHFSHLVEINFELQPHFANCFESLEPTKIVNAINTLIHQKIEPGKTLLFLDEIQECPRAIMALRYFKEQMPSLHVMGAGSLLEFAMKDEQFRMPVGRVQSLYLKPLSLIEYLKAAGYENLIEVLAGATPESGLDKVATYKLEELLHEYFILGGMPDVISHYLEHHDLPYCQIIQAALLNTYRNDFGKYASSAKHKYLQRLYEKTPGMVGQHFQYSKVDPNMQSRDLKSALENLVDAGLIYQIYASKASGLPLNAFISEKKFKLLFIDIGLVKATSLLDVELIKNKDLMLINRGVLVEQFVGQELLAYGPTYQAGQLFYWERAKPSSTAEVDYVINVEEHVVPIEVKSGKTGSLRSLQLFLDEKKLPFGVRLSLAPLSYKNRVLSVPLYMAHEVPRLVQWALGI